MRWIALSVVTAGLAASLGTWNVSRLYVAADPRGPEQVFTIAEREPLIVVATRLRRAGMFPDRLLAGPRIWTWLARAQGQSAPFRSGEYDLSPRLTPAQILEKLSAGQVKTYSLTFSEGSDMIEIAQRLEAAQIAPRDALLERAFSPQFAESLGVEAASLEGYVLPETYRFSKGTSAEAVLREMVQPPSARLTPRDREKLSASGMSLHHVLTLASVVEKEAKTADEKPLIAAVFRNRIDRRMRLQSDSTVLYGILRARGSFAGSIGKAELETDTPYNTYTRGGLPAGPIASVGIDSIRAVLAPANVPYLYFALRSDGTHSFSSSLEQHIDAVNQHPQR